jgi:hypothetical protein
VFCLETTTFRNIFIAGANLTLDCEARGFPAPTITWQYDNAEGQTIALPRLVLKI